MAKESASGATSIHEVLMRAWAHVESAESGGMPHDLREMAFSKAVDLEAAKALGGPAPASGLGVFGSSSNGGDESAPDGDPLGGIASRLGLDQALIADVFNSQNGELELIVASGKLPSRSAPGSKEIALLVAAGRQGAGLEDWTALNVIRATCEDYKRLDPANFASTIKEMRTVFTFRGSPRRREVKMTRPAWDSAASLVRRLAGEGQP